MTIQFDHLKLPTLSFLCGPLCNSVARKTKQTQFAAISIKNQRLLEKRTQIKPILGGTFKLSLWVHLQNEPKPRHRNHEKTKRSQN